VILGYGIPSNPTYLSFQVAYTNYLSQKCDQNPRSSPCANCKTRSTLPPKAAICIKSAKRWWWSRSARRWNSCRSIPSGIFSALGMYWCRRFCWGGGENNVNLAFFTENGRFFGLLQGRQSGNVLLRRAQYRVSEQNPVPIARNIIATKIQASKRVLLVKSLL